MILRARHEAVGLEQGQHLDQRLGAHLGQMLGQLAARLVGVDVVRDLQENRTRVQALLHPHDRDSGLLEAVHNRPFHRCGPAQLGEEGRVKV